MTSFVGGLLKKLGKKHGIKVALEPMWGFAGQVTTKKGGKRYFRGQALDLNTLGASEIAADKDYAAFFMKKMGYPLAKGEAFFSDAWAKVLKSPRNMNAAYRFGKKLGFPVIVKPNSKGQGWGVQKVYTKEEFYRAYRFAAKNDKVILVQEALSGHDYRIVVLDGKIISAYERIPLYIAGDEKTTIRGLLEKKQREFIKAGRDTILNLKDYRIMTTLRHLKKTFRSVLKRGETINLLSNANLSTGGDAKDVTRLIHRGFKKIAITLTRDMGLRFAGVDLMIQGTIAEKPSKYWVLEINSAPGLDNYASQGKKQKKKVEALYLEVLRSLHRG